VHQEGSPPRFAGYRLLLGVASLVVVGAGLVSTRSIMAPFLLALLIAMAGALPLQWLQNRRVPGPVAAILVALLIAGAAGLLVLVATRSLEGFNDSLPTYRTQLNALFSRIDATTRPHGLDLSNLLAQADETLIVGVLGNLFQALARSFSSLATATVILIFILLEAAEYKVKFRAALSRSMDVNRLERVVQDVQRYLFVKTLTSGLTGLLVGALCAVMGVEFAVLWGLTAFLLNYIPVVGSIVASFPALLLAAVSMSWAQVLLLAVGYVVINTAVSNFLEPTLMGRHLGLSPLVVFMGLVFWGWAWGPLGMFLSVPITMLVKILLENSDDLRWVAILMGSARGLRESDSEA
jgi:predicted PurR-regulated permease PerM